MDPPEKLPIFVAARVQLRALSIQDIFHHRTLSLVGQKEFDVDVKSEYVGIAHQLGHIP